MTDRLLTEIATVRLGVRKYFERTQHMPLGIVVNPYFLSLMLASSDANSYFSQCGEVFMDIPIAPDADVLTFRFIPPEAARA